MTENQADIVQEQIIESNKEEQQVDQKQQEQNQSVKKEQSKTKEKQGKRGCKKVSIESKEKLISTLTVANAMMGTCYLTLPFIFKRIGWGLGLAALILCALYTTVGYRTVIKAAHAINIGSMRKIIETLLGKWVSVLIDVAVCLEFTGYLICYVSVVGDYFRLAVINFGGPTIKPLYIKLCFAVILFLLTLIKSLECFSRISSFSIAFITLTVLSAVGFCIKAHVDGTFTINLYNDKTQENNVVENFPVPNWIDLVGPANDNWGYAILEFFMRLPVFQTLFGQYACVTGIYHDMQSPKEQKPKVLNFATMLATVYVTVMYIAMSLSANSMFGRNVASNVLLSFPPTLTWMTVCRLLCCFSVSVSYVLILYSVRNVVMSWLPFKEGTKKYNLSFYLIGLVVVIITAALSILIPDIEVVLNFISAIFGCVWYTLLVAMMVYSIPKINAANYDRQIKELKTGDDEKKQIDMPVIRSSIEILTRNSGSFVYDVGTKEDQETVNQLQQHLDRRSVSIELQEARKSISRLSQGLEKIEDTVENNDQRQSRFADNITIAQEQLEDVSDTKQDEEEQKDLDIEKKTLELIESKDKELSRMNCCRKTVFGIVLAILIAINLEAFVLSTFFDMTKDEPFSNKQEDQKAESTVTSVLTKDQQVQQQPEQKESTQNNDNNQNLEKTKSKRKFNLASKETLIATITLANSMMGTSYLALPYQYKRLGWPLGLFATVFCGCWTTVGFLQTVKAADAIQIGSLRKILETLFGKAIGYVIDGAVCLEYTGYLICYVSVVADYFRIAIINFGGPTIDQLYLKLGFGVLFLILSFIKTLSCFSRIASFAMLFIVITVISIVVYCIIGHVNGTFTINRYTIETPDNPDPTYIVPSWGSLAAPEATNSFYIFLEFFMRLPIFQTLYGVYATITAVYHDMSSPVEQRAKILKKSSVYSAIIVVLIYSVSSLAANALFGRDVVSNVLLSFPSSEVWMTVCRLLSCFSVSVSYVLIIYPVRTIILSWLPFKEGSVKHKISFYVIGLIIVFITVLLSILIPDIEVVLNFISAIFGCVWYAELVVMMVFADPLIKSAKVDRLLLELKQKQSQKEESQQKDPLEILNRRSSFVYEIGDEKENEKAQQIIKQNRQSIDKINEQNKDATIENIEDNNQQPVIAVELQPETVGQLTTTQQISEEKEVEEDIDYQEEERKLLEEKKQILKGMNIRRKVVFGVVTVIVIVINVEALVLSTFFDMTKDEPFKK